MLNPKGLSKRLQRGAGFTLVELLIVVAIIAVLLSILVPSLNRVRETAKEVACKAQMKQMGYAFLGYEQSNNGYWPWQEWVEERLKGLPPKFWEWSVNVSAGNALVPKEVAAKFGMGEPESGWCTKLVPYLGDDYKVFCCPASRHLPTKYELDEPWGQWQGKYKRLGEYAISYLYNGAAIRLKSGEFDNPSSKILVHDFNKRSLAAQAEIGAGKHYWSQAYEVECDYPYPWYSLMYDNMVQFIRSKDAYPMYPSSNTFFTDVKMSWNIHRHGSQNYGRNLLMMDGHVEWHKWGTFLDSYLPGNILKASGYTWPHARRY